MKKKLLLAGLLGILFLLYYSNVDPWGKGQGEPWTKGEVKDFMVNGEMNPYQIYKHPTGVWVKVPLDYPVTIDANRLTMQGPGCNKEEIFSAFATREEACKEASRWIRKTRREVDKPRGKQFAKDYDAAEVTMSASRPGATLSANIPDSDESHQYQQNLFVQSNDQCACFRVERACTQKEQKHPGRQCWSEVAELK